MTFTHKLAERLGRLRIPPRTAIAATLVVAVFGCEKPFSVSPASTITQLVISPKSVALQPNQGYDFIAVGFTATGDSADISVTWSATSGNVTASTSGKRHYGHYQNASCGAHKVAATSTPGNLSDTATVTVSGCNVPVATVTLSPTAINLQIGQTSQLTVTLKDANGNVLTGRTVTWSSDNGSVATVSGTGLVTAAGVGTATITATSEAKSGTASVTVSSVPVAAVTVSPATASLIAGQTVQLTATLKDPNGNILTGRPVTWSSNTTGVATVNSTGLVTAKVAGTATITATSEGRSGMSAVTVTGASASVVLVGAGDIADCDAEPTAALLDNIPGTVFTAGDNAYPDGSGSDYAQCYDPSWGRHKARTRPAPGNHDYNTSGASGYYGYFGSLAGQSGVGYYSYDLGAWHIVSLNSNVSMSAGSAQETWLGADLAASTKRCTIAYWHHPRFSSGSNHGSSTQSAGVFQALYDAGAEIVIVGHDHEYERFAPQTPNGASDPVAGIREFVVGTGGAGLYSFATPLPNSEVRDATSHGVLKLTLSDGSYTWEFIPVAGDSFRDSGSGTCH
jgi:acid phosphatase type 7